VAAATPTNQRGSCFVVQRRSTNQLATSPTPQRIHFIRHLPGEIMQLFIGAISRRNLIQQLYGSNTLLLGA